MKHFHHLYNPGMQQHRLIIQCSLRSVICQMVAYRRLKTKENCKLLALKVSRSLKRGGSLQEIPSMSDLTRKLLVATGGSNVP